MVWEYTHLRAREETSELIKCMSCKDENLSQILQSLLSKKNKIQLGSHLQSQDLGFDDQLD